MRLEPKVESAGRLIQFEAQARNLFLRLAWLITSGSFRLALLITSCSNGICNMYSLEQVFALQTFKNIKQLC